MADGFKNRQQIAEDLPAVGAEVTSLFRYSEPGRLAHLLAEQGFEDAVPERITEWAPFRDVEEYWGMISATTRLGSLARGLSDDAIAECKAELERKTRFYRRTRSGRKQLQAETRGWEETTAIIARFFAVKAADLK